MFGFFFVALQYLHLIKDYSPLEASLAMVPLALAAMIFSPIAPKLAVGRGFRIVNVAGMAMIAVVAVVSPLDADSGYPPLLFGTFMLSVGIVFAATRRRARHGRRCRYAAALRATDDPLQR